MASSPVPFKLAAVILAAGASKRMGTPKLLLPWGQTSILGHLLQTWTELGVCDLAVIIAPADTPIPAELDRLRSPARRIVNPEPARGMFSSIQCAAAWPEWSPDITHWAIVLGDQPQLSSTTLSVLLTFAAANPQKISQPARARSTPPPGHLARATFLRTQNRSPNRPP